MPRFRHLSSAVAVALAFSGAAQAQSFSNYIVFGDSLSDAGNVGDLLGLPAGSSFTTNQDPVYAQIIGDHFGFTITNGSYSPLLPGATGTDFAVGGACANPDSATFFCTNDPSGTGAFSVTNQLNDYLGANGGVADPNALYSVWSGANDIFSALTLPNTRLAATTTIGLITQLQNAGARNIIVFNLPNLGITPDVIGTANSFGATTLSQVYNDTFNAGLSGLHDGIIPVDVYRLIQDITADPGLYGFTDVIHKACGAGSTSVDCGPAGDPDYTYHYAPGTNDSFLFADSVHPTGAGHRLLAAVVLSELEAPGQISMLGEAALRSYDDHARIVHDQIWDSFGADRADDSTVGFAHVQYSNIDYDLTANTPQTDMNQTSVVVGADYRGNEHYNLGGALSLGTQQIDAGGARMNGRAAMFTVYGVWNFGHGYLDAVAGGGNDSFNIHRHILLGPADRVEDSDTNATHVVFELGGGYQFGDEIKHGPFVDVTWQKVDVGDLIENGIDSTEMTFDGYTRDSLITRLGYQLRSSGNRWHPFARVAYNNESRNEPSQVRAGLVHMNGHFVLPGLVPSDNWWTADLGVTWDVNDTTSASMSYSGVFADDVQDRNTINLGVKLKF
jgi:outer membrane lipase/esterase